MLGPFVTAALKLDTPEVVAESLENTSYKECTHLICSTVRKQIYILRYKRNCFLLELAIPGQDEKEAYHLDPMNNSTHLLK